MAIVLNGSTGISAPDIDSSGAVTATSYAGNGANLTGVLRKGPDIGASVDLDTYDTDGYYHQNLNTSATNGTNYPANLAGMLTVTSDGNMVYQHYQTYNGSGAYQRTKYNTTWYAWDKILDSGNLTTTGTVTATAFAGDGSALTGVVSTTAGAVGTYAYLVNTGIDTSISQGTSIAGSSLRYSGHSSDSLTTSTDNWSVSHTVGGANPSGTWRSMGSRGTSVGRNYFQTLFLRIS